MGSALWVGADRGIGDFVERNDERDVDRCRG